MSARKRRVAAVAALGVLLLSGCTAQARTDVTITSESSADIVVAAQFTAEAAQAMTKGSQARLDLLEVFSQRTGQDPKIESSDEQVTISAHIDYASLGKVADVVGVQALKLSGDADATTATVTLRDASALLSAIETGIAQEQDAAALRAAMVKSTELVLTVRFPGGVDAASDTEQVPGVKSAQVKGSTFTLVRHLESAGAGQVVVSGDTTPNLNVPLLVAGAAALLAAGGAALVARSRRR